jgi:hypothetical protein
LVLGLKPAGLSLIVVAIGLTECRLLPRSWIVRCSSHPQPRRRSVKMCKNVAQTGGLVPEVDLGKLFFSFPPENVAAASPLAEARLPS